MANCASVATTVAPDWLANELAGRGKVDTACRDRMVMHLMTAAGASAPADAVFRFTAGEVMRTEDATTRTPTAPRSIPTTGGCPTCSWPHPYLTPSAPPSSDPPG